VCDARGARWCDDCKGIRILPDNAVPVLRQAEAIAKARAKDAEEKLSDAQAERDRLVALHHEATEALRAAKKAALTA
jgi:F0F1-type ATP synthase epsilon subunit